MNKQNDQITRLQMEVAMALHSMAFLIPDGKLKEGQRLSKRIEDAVLTLGKLAEEAIEEDKE